MWSFYSGRIMVGKRAALSKCLIVLLTAAASGPAMAGQAQPESGALQSAADLPDIPGASALKHYASGADNADNIESAAAILAKKHDAAMYFARAEISAHPAEKAQYYLLAGKLLCQYPGSVPGQTARGLYVKAADIYRATPTALGADRYFLAAKLAEPENADWPYLVAVYNWDKNLDIAEQYLKESLRCKDASPGTFQKAAGLLVRLPQQRAALTSQDPKIAKLMEKHSPQKLNPPSKLSLDNMDDLFQDGPGEITRPSSAHSHWWNKLQDGF